MSKKKLEDTQFYRLTRIYLDLGTAFVVALIVLMIVGTLLGNGFFSVIITLAALVALMLYGFKINQRFLKFVLLVSPLVFTFSHRMQTRNNLDFTIGVTLLFIGPVLFYLYIKYFYKPKNTNPANIKNVTRGTNLYED